MPNNLNNNSDYLIEFASKLKTMYQKRKSGLDDQDITNWLKGYMRAGEVGNVVTNTEIIDSIYSVQLEVFGKKLGPKSKNESIDWEDKLGESSYEIPAAERRSKFK